jgi:hypothetical protein
MITFSKLGKLGRLGNQMFQVAATMGTAHRNGAQYMIPKWYYQKFFKHQFTQGHRTGHTFYSEPDFTYSHPPVKSNLELYGYFQSAKYFGGLDMKEIFTPTDEVNKHIEDKYGDLLQGETVSIHIRRGDYLQLSDYHYNLPENYYGDAIVRTFQTLKPNATIKDPKYLIFSDDIEWCKNHNSGSMINFIEGNEDIIDLFLMSKCKHNIIANSSFSWWASYLNNNPDKIVVAPTKEKWFGSKMNKSVDDLYLNTWTLI